MKKILLILNVVLLLAVAWLYYLVLSDRHSVKEVEHKSSDTTQSIPIPIAYVNSDTLLQQYHFYDELEKKLTTKKKKLEKEFQNRAAGLQRQYEDYKKTMNNMTLAQAKAVEEDLGKKQQNLRQYQESLNQKLMKEEEKITRSLYEEVAAYLKKYGEKHNLQVVLTYTQGSGVLYANDSLNITPAVIEGLNAAYDVRNKANLTDSLNNRK